MYHNCSEFQNKNNNLCTQHVLQVFWVYNFHEQWTICCGLVDAKIRASYKDLPVFKNKFWKPNNWSLHFDLIDKTMHHSHFKSPVPYFNSTFYVFSGYLFGKTTKQQAKMVMGFSRRKENSWFYRWHSFLLHYKCTLYWLYILAWKRAT